MFRTRLSLIIVLLALAWPCFGDYGGRYYGPNFRYYGYYNGPYHPDHYLELARIRRELRDQRRLGTARLRRQEQQLDLLRQQNLVNHQVTARQACYYRSTGGFELCADLYTQGSDEFAACESLVIRRNHSCNDVPLKGREASGSDE